MNVPEMCTILAPAKLYILALCFSPFSNHTPLMVPPIMCSCAMLKSLGKETTAEPPIMKGKLPAMGMFILVVPSKIVMLAVPANVPVLAKSVEHYSILGRELSNNQFLVLTMMVNTAAFTLNLPRL